MSWQCGLTLDNLQAVKNFFFVKTKKHKFFLLDGSGALLSLFIMAIILPAIQEYIGMPTRIFYYLASIAFLFACYSWTCYFVKLNHWHSYAKGIIIGNSLYCILTLALVYRFYEPLTTLGLSYFAVELLVITLLIVYEIKQLLNKSGEE